MHVLILKYIKRESLPSCNKLLCIFVGKRFSNEENFGQFPLQVNGFRDIHESLEAATAQGEIETINRDATQKSGQEVK